MFGDFDLYTCRTGLPASAELRVKVMWHYLRLTAHSTTCLL